MTERSSLCDLYDDGRVVFRYADPHDNSPFEVAVRSFPPNPLHEQHESIRDRHRAWAEAAGIPSDETGFQRYCDTRLDLLASYQCHDLSEADAVLHSHLMTWFFVFDDIMDIDHDLDEEVRPLVYRLFRRHLDLLDGALPGLGEPRCILAFHDLLARVRVRAGRQGAAWHGRMVRHLREYVSGAHWESMIGPTTERNANTALYLQVRHLAVGVAPCLDLMSMLAGIDPGPLVDDFFIQRLERLAINYSIWINDLAGLGRDLRRRLGNIVFTLQQDHGLTLRDAALMVGRLCDAEREAFEMLEAQLPVLVGERYGTDRAAYEGYGMVLRNWMRGLVDWSARSARYQELDRDMSLQNDQQIRSELRGRPGGEEGGGGQRRISRRAPRGRRGG